MTSAACAPDLGELTSGVRSACDGHPNCDAGSSRDGATTKDAGLTDVSLPDASDVRDGARTEVADTSPAEASDAANDPPRDAGGEPASDAGPDAPRTNPDASDGGPAETGAPAPRVLYTFDWQDGGVDDGGVASEWHGADGTATPRLVDDDSDPNNTTRGALQLHIAWPRYDTGVDGIFLERPFVPSVDLSSYSRLHLWVKVPVVSPSLAFIQGYLNDASYAGVYRPYLAARDITPGVWFEMIATLDPGPSSPLVETARIGLQIIALKPEADAGAAPVPMDIEIDNVWLD